MTKGKKRMPNISVLVHRPTDSFFIARKSVEDVRKAIDDVCSGKLDVANLPYNLITHIQSNGWTRVAEWEVRRQATFETRKARDVAYRAMLLPLAGSANLLNTDVNSAVISGIAVNDQPLDLTRFAA